MSALRIHFTLSTRYIRWLICNHGIKKGYKEQEILYYTNQAGCSVFYVMYCVKPEQTAWFAELNKGEQA